MESYISAISYAKEIMYYDWKTFGLLIKEQCDLGVKI